MQQQWEPIPKVATKIQAHPSTIYNWVKTRKLPHKRITTTDINGKHIETTAVRATDAIKVKAQWETKLNSRTIAIEETQWLITFGWTQRKAIDRIAKLYDIHPGTIEKHFRHDTEKVAA